MKKSSKEARLRNKRKSIKGNMKAKRAICNRQGRAGLSLSHYDTPTKMAAKIVISLITTLRSKYNGNVILVLNSDQRTSAA